MECKFYRSCEKEEACLVLGECVFGHSMLVDKGSSQAILNVYYSKTTSAIANVFCKIKKNKPFTGKEKDAKEHLEKVKSSLK